MLDQGASCSIKIHVEVLSTHLSYHQHFIGMTHTSVTALTTYESHAHQSRAVWESVGQAVSETVCQLLTN